ncbi:MAG: HlyC/CorC family transporter [Ignavibacteriae bacterium]|nr:MAG: HlyC/CorC family transporter [Ignavibacteriota bacterium]
MEFGQYIVDMFIILLFVFLNGFFVAAEFAIVKVRLTQIEPLVAKGNRRAIIAHSLVTNLNAYLSATQLGITMTSLALGWIGEPLIAVRLEPVFTALGIVSTDILHAASFGVAFSVITFLHIILGELAPKSLAILDAKRTALWVAYPLNVFFLIFKPIIWLLNSMANLILHLLGFETVTESELEHSEEELRLILAHDTHVSATTRNIALSAMDFHKKQARHSMIPRKEIIALSVQTPASETIEIMRKNKFSRFPVYKESIDNIIGIVYTKDIFKHDKHLQPDFTLASVLRDATFLPETATLEKVLTTSQQKKTHMIILADEYGGTAGLITLENVLEELVGNIQDEYDRETPDVVKVDDDEYVVAGYVTTNDVERLLSIELSPLDIRSIGGFVIEQLGHIPAVGEQLKLNGVEFTTEKVVDNAIESILVKKIPVPRMDEQDH